MVVGGGRAGAASCTSAGELAGLRCCNPAAIGEAAARAGDYALIVGSSPSRVVYRGDLEPPPRHTVALRRLESKSIRTRQKM